MKLELKNRIGKTLIWSMVLYASETWTLRKAVICHLVPASPENTSVPQSICRHTMTVSS